jgi:hypothetical protein
MFISFEHLSPSYHCVSRLRLGETRFDLVKNRNLIAYPSPEMREHVTNATGVETPRGFRIAKEKASRKIDLAVALAMACCAALQAGKPVTNSRAFPVGVGKISWVSGRTFGQAAPGNPFGGNYGGGKYQTDDD